VEREAQRLQRKGQKIQHANDQVAREAFRQGWTADAIREVGEELQRRVKSVAPPPPGAYIAPFYGVLPQSAFITRGIEKQECGCASKGGIS
jgi:hypothetical protein